MDKLRETVGTDFKRSARLKLGAFLYFKLSLNGSNLEWNHLFCPFQIHTYNGGFHKNPRNTQTHIILVLMLFSTKFKQQRF